MSYAIICVERPFRKGFCVGFFDVLLIIILVAALIGALLFWETRSFTYFGFCALLIVVCVFIMMQSTLGDQIRKQISEQKAEAGKVKRTG